MPRVTEGVNVGTWLDTEVRFFPTMGRWSREMVAGTPETRAELLGPFLPLTKVRSHSGIQL